MMMIMNSIIDFLVVQASDCRLPKWSDHYLVRAKLHFKFQKPASQRIGEKSSRCASFCL